SQTVPLSPKLSIQCDIYCRTRFSMKPILRFRGALLVTLVSFAGVASPQSAGQSKDSTAKILTYIHGSWNTLSRSMTDCKSLVDPKVTTPPVLYLPAGMPTPAAVTAAHQKCNVEIKQLPRKITHIGDVRISDITAEGLLYLPNPYVVPGGRFN